MDVASHKFCGETFHRWVSNLEICSKVFSLVSHACINFSVNQMSSLTQFPIDVVGSAMHISYIAMYTGLGGFFWIMDNN